MCVTYPRRALGRGCHAPFIHNTPNQTSRYEGERQVTFFGSAPMQLGQRPSFLNNSENAPWNGKELELFFPLSCCHFKNQQWFKSRDVTAHTLALCLDLPTWSELLPLMHHWQHFRYTRRDAFRLVSPHVDTCTHIESSLPFLKNYWLSLASHECCWGRESVKRCRSLLCCRSFLYMLS